MYVYYDMYIMSMKHPGRVMSYIIIIRSQDHTLRIIWQVQEHHVVKIIHVTNDNSKSSMFYYPN